MLQTKSDVEVVRSGSERAAAKALEITQPAVSQQIRILEGLESNCSGVTMGRLLPTSQTMTLFRDTDATFVQMERIAKTVPCLKGVDSDTISIAAPHVFSLRLLPEAFHKLRSHQRVAGIVLRSGTYPEVADHVLEGRADLGIARLPLGRQRL
ncbi:LysR family transcriptional regulator [Mesorhizobium abyssinicae]|uniref:LysR family transcriptional regulator n=1 Tax=Mesorhizobium abyssinicae TaxID=1209958 RepID=UPI0033965B4B